MKTITINVSDPVYRDFQEHARRVDRTASELIREAMELYRDQRIAWKGTATLEIPTASVGRVLKPLGPDDDLLAEMLEGTVE
jgi:predicted transcriptional regulator